MKIRIAGDLVLLKEYSLDDIDENIINMFANSDFNIVNLEAPITDSTIQIAKTGPHLKSNRKSILNVLKGLNVNLVTLANNHILDYGKQGINDTLNFCQNNGIFTVGAGRTKREASKIFYLNSGQNRVAIINIAENEWASATEEEAGSNGMDLIDNVTHIKKAKNDSDFVIVIVHGGHEHYNFPSPRMQKQYRFYIDNGADLVVGHHPHCISGFEKYNGKDIYYSLGNFLFQTNNKRDGWYEGGILEVEISKSGLQSSISFVTVDRESFKLHCSSDNDLIDQFFRYSNIIEDSSALNNEWQKFIKSKKTSYRNYWSPFNALNNRYVKRLFFKLGIDGLSRNTALLYSNLIRCEAHYDLTKEFFNERVKK